MSKGNKKHSSGGTFDVKPPKGFIKKDEAYFAAEEATLEAEAQRALEEEEKTKVEVNMVKSVKVDIKKNPAKGPAKKPTKKPEKKPVKRASAPTKKAIASDKTPKFRIVSRVFAGIATLVNGLFLLRLLSTSILPAKYAYPILAVTILVTIFYIFKAFRNKTRKGVLIFLDVIAVIASAALLFATARINEVFRFLDGNFNSNKQVAIYNVIVNKDSEYKEISDLKDKTIKTYEELIKDVSDEKLKAAVSEKIPGSTLTFSEDIDEVMKSILSDKAASILVNEGTYGSYLDNDETYEGKVKIIGTIEIEIDNSEATADKKDLTNTPFIILISGIDTRTDRMPTRSLSDVNILAVVNPNTKKMALITTPRDYYVQLHGTTGLKDKLTHAGSRGGVQLTAATLADLYGVDVDRYIRVNFNFVVKLVNAIGGITVNNDVDHVIKTAKTNYGKQCTFQPGDNDVDGDCALSFARERHAYSDGDRHRGRNQSEVISKILKKVTSGTTILTRYSEILKSLEGTFDSNISTEDITSLVRMQLDDMKSWEVDSYSVNGKGAMTTTYSYPNQNLYVMEPDMNTVNTAKQKIQAVLNDE